ncbi:hypothetical protein [Variovorax sp. PCZ-1]|uniref:hypothetical protein n=1 Tax=Variovorax sp. PCZ-1 TaxID=2835533 RepID=UPI001BCC1627|nr:hypothetical protein [Variovorax sp. PCZ-1]MBS7806224.1 hypothetical protein [Variovorax sp. PCZ-1]
MADGFELKIQPLSKEEIDQIRGLVDETISRWPDTSGKNSIVRLGLYEFTWTVNSLDQTTAENMAWVFSEIGFKTELLIRDAQLPGEVVANTFYAVLLKRQAVFHPDYLFGEALSIATVAQMHSCHLEGFQIDGHQPQAGRIF